MPVNKRTKLNNKSEQLKPSVSSGKGILESTSKRSMDLESQHESIRQGFNKVLEAHGFGDHEVTSFTASDVPAPTAAGMCRVWRCWDTPNGRQCGWVWEPC
jgi:hypothetical protein